MHYNRYMYLTRVIRAANYFGYLNKTVEKENFQRKTRTKWSILNVEYEWLHPDQFFLHTIADAC